MKHALFEKKIIQKNMYLSYLPTLSFELQETNSFLCLNLAREAPRQANQSSIYHNVIHPQMICNGMSFMHLALEAV